MNEEKTYPVTYETFKNRIINNFLEKDWEYGGHLTRQQKQEFIDKHDIDFKEDYAEECENYDKGFLNVFTTPQDTHKYILGLLFDCEMYFNSKKTVKSLKSKIDESKYPMTYKEFEKALGEAFVKNAPKRFWDVTEDEARKDWENFLEEDGSQRYIYEELCKRYDKTDEKNKERIFSDESLAASVSPLIEWVYF